MTSRYDLWKEYFGRDYGRDAHEDQNEAYSGGYAPSHQPFFAQQQETNVDVVNIVDIDVENDVTVVQDLEVDIDIGAGASAVIGGGLLSAPEQAVAVGNVDGGVAAGAVAAEAGGFGFGAPHGHGFGGLANVTVINSTDIDIVNTVTSIQSTLIDIDVGPGAHLALGASLNSAPPQNVAVGNVDAEAEAGAVAIEADSAIG